MKCLRFSAGIINKKSGEFMNGFSVKPSGRRVLVVLPEHEYDKLLHHDPQGTLHNPQVNVVRYGDVENESILHPVLQKLDRHGLLAPGKVLIQDPFSPDIYYDQVEALRQIALRKHFHLSVICQKLGAKSLKVTQVNVVSKKEKTSGAFDGNVKLFDASGSYAKTLEDKLKQEMKLTEEWSGCDADVEGAGQYLEKYCLDADITLCSLVEMFSSPGNRLSKRTIKMNASSEANRNLKICAAIGLDAIASLEGSFEKESVKTQDVELTIDIGF